MKNKYTLYMLSNSGTSVKKFSVSKSIILILSCFFMVCFILFGVILYDYNNLRSASFKNETLRSRITSHVNDIAIQHKQIQEFAEEINRLKARLVDLADFEKKIRIMANIEKKDGEEGLFGMGGSVPDDLDTAIALEDKHNSLVREMHEQVDQLDVAVLNQEEGFETLLKRLEEQRNYLASTPSIRPTTGWITSRFGYRDSPFTGKKEFHKGLDIANRMKSPIYATADGVVSFAGKKGLLGNVVIIDHGYGMVTRYGHCYKVLKKSGDKVRRGDKVAMVGNTGRSTGSHLHYEVLLNGVPVNPEKYFLD